MAYSAGNLILDDEYNTFVTGSADGTGNISVPNVNTIWATGSGAKGYGQTGNVSAVSAGTTITATQWASLFGTFTGIANHTGTTVTSISNPTTGDTIEAISTFEADLTTLFNSSANAAASGSDITSNGTISTTNSWTNTAILEQTFDFGTPDQFRYFFNAGGMIRLAYSRAGGSGHSKNAEWTDLLTKTGTIALTGLGSTKNIAGTDYTGTTKIGGSGTADTLATSTGAYDLTTSNTVLFKQFADTSPYTTNYIQIQARVNNDTTPTTITITTTLDDDRADDFDDTVNGTLTGTHVIRPPSTTYLTASWGTPSMQSASWSTS